MYLLRRSKDNRLISTTADQLKVQGITYWNQKQFKYIVYIEISQDLCLCLQLNLMDVIEAE